MEKITATLIDQAGNELAKDVTAWVEVDYSRPLKSWAGCIEGLPSALVYRLFVGNDKITLRAADGRQGYISIDSADGGSTPFSGLDAWR